MVGYSIRIALKGAKALAEWTLADDRLDYIGIAFCKLPCISLEGVLAAYKTAYWPLGATFHGCLHTCVA
jgi:hypothetical protein